MAQVIIRLTLSSNAIGPFDIHTGSTQTTLIAQFKRPIDVWLFGKFRWF